MDNYVLPTDAPKDGSMSKYIHGTLRTAVTRQEAQKSTTNPLTISSHGLAASPGLEEVWTCPAAYDVARGCECTGHNANLRKQPSA
jgi:hypothetical protein